jgi:RNA recognition motif-containing protein
MALATDKNTGKPKGFAFIWIAEGDKGEAIVAKMNGSELMGRKIKVDLAQGGKKSSPAASGGDGKPAKSNRELQAMREEDQDSKKPRSRPHPKKE